MNIVRAPKGTARKVVPLSEVRVPDLWHLYEALSEQAEKTSMELRPAYKAQAAMAVECWHLAIDLLENLRQLEAMGVPHSLDTGILAPHKRKRA